MQFRLVSRREEITTEEGRHLSGAGYVICDAETGSILGDEDFFFRIGGGMVCDMAGAEDHLVQLQADAFAPGQTLTLVRAGDVIDVCDQSGLVTVGRLPTEVAEALTFSETQTYDSALCLWEWRSESGRRFALRLLLAPGWKAERLPPS